MKVTFDKKWFNPLYFILNDLLKDNSIRTILVYGGKSSAKTASISQILMKELVVHSCSSIAFRKESTSIPTTLKESLKLARDCMYVYPVVQTQDRRFLCGPKEIVLKGIDDEEKAKGVEGYKYLFLDELNHFDIGEYEQFQMSLRGIEGQKIFAAWNPVDENSWVKTDLIDVYEWTDTDYKLPSANSFVRISNDGKIILIKTTFEDNYFISGSPCGTYGYRDENLISYYKSLQFRDFNKYRVNVLGEWGKVVYGGEFLKGWKSEVHVSDCKYNPDLAIHLIFDENVNPYFPCGIFQVSKNEKEFQMIHLITMKNPDNTIRAMCNEIRRKLLEWRHKEAVYIGGDATSKKSDVKQEKGHDLFHLIMVELKEFAPRRAVLNSNPSVRASADFTNGILSYEEQGLRYRVDRGCKQAIIDYENTKEDKNGGVDKKTVTDPLTKISYQPFGHIVDLTRYFICYTFAKEFYNFQRGSNMPLPSIGRNYSKNVM
jgi:phage terminase large subunit